MTKRQTIPIEIMAQVAVELGEFTTRQFVNELKKHHFTDVSDAQIRQRIYTIKSQKESPIISKGDVGIKLFICKCKTVAEFMSYQGSSDSVINKQMPWGAQIKGSGGETVRMVAL